MLKAKKLQGADHVQHNFFESRAKCNHFAGRKSTSPMLMFLWVLDGKMPSQKGGAAFGQMSMGASKGPRGALFGRLSSNLWLSHSVCGFK